MNTRALTQLQSIPVAISCILQTRFIYKCVITGGNVRNGLRSVICITNMMKSQILVVVLLSADQLSAAVCLTLLVPVWGFQVHLS